MMSMFCPNCGQPVNDGVVFCTNCGKSLSAHIQSVPPAQTPVSPGVPIQSIQPAQPGMPEYQAYAPANPAPVRKKKRHGCLIAFLVFLGFLAAVAAAAYFLLPGLFRPVNLGVKTTKQAYESALTKLHYEKDPAPQKGLEQDYTYVFGPLVPVDTDMSSEEVTSFLSYNRPNYFPVSNVQVRIGEASAALDGDTPIEVSATLHRDFLINKLSNSDYTKEEIEDGLDSIGISKLIPPKINIYFKMGGTIVDNKVGSINLYNLSILGYSVPRDQLQSTDMIDAITDLINDLLADYSERSGTTFKSISVEDGKILIDGQVPSSLTRKPAP